MRFIHDRKKAATNVSFCALAGFVDVTAVDGRVCCAHSDVRMWSWLNYSSRDLNV
jgi:hypothetical protein